ncbi:hypothetical protein SLEP1_g57232 [Rubroshorea leprosula]|uniref:Reverse transcriptase Ty1/copia-type domain-containing protein n=1 Tax=Rubroshorea leprosula TaxID=152421 RepID=A0AAV5MNF4_9ROSI|nr:hypothetical protein SLEP1_g57232 [Rubroshorea leprosula]
MSIRITVEHPVPHMHTQNGMAESLIKRLQLIARPLLMRSKLPASAWGHAILHAATLIRLRPTAYHKHSPLQLVSGIEPNISHLKIFGCAVYVPIAPTQHTKMGPQRRLGIYVGFESPSIIKYLEPMTSDLFTTRFADCHFDENLFPALGGEEQKLKKQELTWDALSISHLDPRTGQSELEVQKIIHLQKIANQLPDAFTDAKKVTSSHIPVLNVPARIDILVQKGAKTVANESIIRQKHGKPVGSKDKNPRMKRKQNAGSIEIVETQKFSKQQPENASKEIIPEKVQVVENNEDADIENNEDADIENNEDADIENNDEISINYISTGIKWNRNDVVIDDVFAFAIANDIVNENEDLEPKSIEECQQRGDWPKWKDAIQAELKSLEKRQVFGPIVQTPNDVKPVGYKWVFVRKRNEKNEVVRYKARLVAQGFTQIPGVDHVETYSPVMDAITFRFLISLAVSEGLQMRLMDVVTAYLYGSLDSDIDMKVPIGVKMPEAYNSMPREIFSIKLKQSLYGLKQSGRMWYNCLSEYLLKEGYENNPISPCVFTKRSKSGFAIIAVYVDDINIIGTSGELEKAIEYLKKEFEMKDLGTTKFCLGLQIEHLSNGIFVHQLNYVEKILKRFNMDKSHPLSSPMVVRSLDVKKDPFRPREDNEEILGPEQDIVLHQHEDIGMALNIYSIIFKEQKIWDYFTQSTQN